jgi:putative ABC transport system permease protein
VPTGHVFINISAISETTDKGRRVGVPAGLTDTKRWTSSSDLTFQASAQGLSTQINLDPFGSPTKIAPDDVPKELPAVVTPQVPSLNSNLGGSLSLVGLDGATLTGRAVGEVPALPRIGANASIVDLGLAERYLSGPFANTTEQVWLANDAPKDIVSRLGRNGITVVSVDSASEREALLLHSGVSLAYLLFLISAIASVALAVGATGFAAAAGARRRSSELAAMRILGIPASSLRHSLELEQFLTVATGIIVGAAAGLVAVAVAMRSVPEFVAVGPGPPLLLGLPGYQLAVGLGILVVALVCTVGIAAMIVVSSASAERLGGSQV